MSRQNLLRGSVDGEAHASLRTRTVHVYITVYIVFINITIYLHIHIYIYIYTYKMLYVSSVIKLEIPSHFSDVLHEVPDVW